MHGVLWTGIAAFAATNLDDLLLLCLLFGQAGTSADRRRIALGQVLGLTVLTVVSLLGGLGLGQLPAGILRLLGLVPIALGLRMLFGKTEERSAGLSLSVRGVAALAVANGGDNLGLYLPLFAQRTPGGCLLTAAIFLLMAGLWCLLGAFLAKLPPLERFLRRWGGKMVPAVFLLLGVSILLA